MFLFGLFNPGVCNSMDLPLCLLIPLIKNNNELTNVFKHKVDTINAVLTVFHGIISFKYGLKLNLYAKKIENTD